MKNLLVGYDSYSVDFVETNVCRVSYYNGQGKLISYGNVVLRKGNEDCVALRDVLGNLEEEVSVSVFPREMQEERLLPLQRIVEGHNQSVRESLGS